MLEGALQGDRLQLRFGVASERAAGSGDDEFFDRVVLLACKALEDGRMFGIDWQHRGVVLFGGAHDELARDH